MKFSLFQRDKDPTVEVYARNCQGFTVWKSKCSCGWKAILDGLDKCRANIPESHRFTWCRTEEQAQIALDQHLLENPETLLSRQELIKDYSV